MPHTTQFLSPPASHEVAEPPEFRCTLRDGGRVRALIWA